VSAEVVVHANEVRWGGGASQSTVKQGFDVLIVYVRDEFSFCFWTSFLVSLEVILGPVFSAKLDFRVVHFSLGLLKASQDTY
jgi:hypothetical protein